MKFFFLFLLSTLSCFADEASLLQGCKNKDLKSCEQLGAFYIQAQSWEKALVVGQGLCDKDIIMGCTFAGSSQLAMGKIKEGSTILIRACDKFEPYACRSLGRLMKKNKQDKLSHMYFRRSCHYGLKSVCDDLRPKKDFFSKSALAYLKQLPVSCAETQSSACQEHLTRLQSCQSPLGSEDCQLIPGQLSLYFRARLMQSEAKFSLMGLVAAQRATLSQQKKYDYDLKRVLKDYKPLASYHYVFGFLKPCAKKYEPSRATAANSLELFPQSYSFQSAKSAASIRSYFEKGKGEECYDPKAGFEAFAVASLDPMNPSRLDVWKVNQDNNMIQVQDGTPAP